MKSRRRLLDALAGKLPMEELTEREVRLLERRVFKALARRKAALPGNPTKH